MKNSRFNILLTNDDGIKAEGLRALKEIVSPFGKVYTVAPMKESSGVSHAINPREKLKLKKINSCTVALNGTPADCVKYAVFKFIKKPIHLLVSGINRGENAGSDVSYSATVAAAAEGCLLKIPSIAISVGSRNPVSFYEGRSCIEKLCGFVLKYSIPVNTFLNVNIPGKIKADEIKGVLFTSQGEKIYKDVVSECRNNNGHSYCYINTRKIIGKKSKGNDIYALSRGYISITPLQLNMTNYSAIAKLRKSFCSFN